MADFKDLVPNWAEASQCILCSLGKTVLHWPFLKAMMPCKIRISSYCWYLWGVPSRHRKWMEARSVTEGTRMEVFQLYKFLWVGSDAWIKMECFMSVPVGLCYLAWSRLKHTCLLTEHASVAWNVLLFFPRCLILILELLWNRELQKMLKQMKMSQSYAYIKEKSLQWPHFIKAWKPHILLWCSPVPEEEQMQLQ